MRAYRSFGQPASLSAVVIVLIALPLTIALSQAPHKASAAYASRLAGDFDPSWSPNGARLVFTRDTRASRGLRVVDLKRGRISKISHGDEFEPAWRPNGREIVAVRGTGPVCAAAGRRANADLFLLTRVRNRRKMLTHDPAQDFEPAWSPDGLRIVFTSTRGATSPLKPDQACAGTTAREAAVYVMNADGSRPEKLAQGYDPAWSPDGREIAFTEDADAGESGIYIIDAGGRGTPVRLTKNADRAAEPSWSPDGRKIAFTKWSSEWVPDVYVMNHDGSGQVRLAHGYSPSWSPNGKTIAFVGMTFPRAIFLVPGDGGRPRQVTRPPRS